MASVAFSVLIFILVVSPFALDLFLRKEYTVHKNGVIVITGCSSGIGRHAALELAKSGYVVFAGVRKDKDSNSLKEEAKSISLPKEGAVVPIVLDVTSSSQIENAVKEVSEYLKKSGLPFVGIVNNAGISARTPYESINLVKARQVFETNFWGVIEVTQKFLPLIRRDKGRVLFVSSLLGVLTSYGTTVYSSSKHALEASADALRLEMYDFDVPVSIIEPGYINSSIVEVAIADPKTEVTTEQEGLYKTFWEKMPPQRRQAFKNSDSPSITSDVIKHALTDKYPHTRYPVGSAGATARLLVILDSLLPDRLLDLLKRGRYG